MEADNLMSNIIHRDSLDTDLDQHKSQSVKVVASLSFAFKKSEKRPDFGTNKNHMLYRRRQALHSFVFTILNMIIASEVPRRLAGSKSIQRRRHKRKDATLFGMLFLFVIILVNLPLAASGQEEPAEQEEPVVDPLSIPADDEPPGVNDPNLVVEEIVAGLKRPTAMSFLGNSSDDIIVTEKDNGTVRRILGGVIQPEPLVDVAVSNDNDTNERGLLGMALSKQNETTTYVFLYYTESGGGQDGDDADGIVPAGNRLYRYELVQNDNGDPTSAELINPKLLLDLPARPGPRYNGGPLLVTQNQSDTFVYLMIGDLDHRRSQAENYEDGPPPDGTGGILVVDAEGNPLPSPGLVAPVNGGEENGEENIGMLPYYFAYGIRNGFGMAFDPVTGYLWDTENGPEWFDEINLVVPGFNSGWAAVSGPASAPENEGADIEEDLETFDERGMYRDPEFAWQNTVGVTGIKFLNSTALGPQYENDIFVGDINHGRIYHFDLNQERTGLMLEGELQDKVANNIGELESVIFGTGFRSITDIEVGPDGNLYVLLYGPGKIFKISLADTEDD